MLQTMGSTYSVHTHNPITDIDGRYTCMACWPTVYGHDGAPSDSADYMGIVYAKGDHNALWEVMDYLKPYGCTSGRWLSDFFREV